MKTHGFIYFGPTPHCLNKTNGFISIIHCKNKNKEVQLDLQFTLSKKITLKMDSWHLLTLETIVIKMKMQEIDIER